QPGPGGASWIDPGDARGSVRASLGGADVSMQLHSVPRYDRRLLVARGDRVPADAGPTVEATDGGDLAGRLPYFVGDDRGAAYLGENDRPQPAGNSGRVVAVGTPVGIARDVPGRAADGGAQDHLREYPGHAAACAAPRRGFGIGQTCHRSRLPVLISHRPPRE